MKKIFLFSLIVIFLSGCKQPIKSTDNISIDIKAEKLQISNLLDSLNSSAAVKENNTWKIKQYILSATVPNEQMDAVIKIKAPIENLLIKKLSNN